MASRKITIILFPEGTSRIRQFTIPRILIFLSVFVSIAAVASLAWVVRDYGRLKAEMPGLVKLERENRQKESQFLQLALRINSLGAKMGKLNDFDQKLKVMVNLETREDETRFKGIGGSDPNIIDITAFGSKSHRDMVKSMHRALDEINNEVSLGRETKEDLSRFLESQKILLASTPSIWPTKGWLSSRFGHRTSPFTGQKEFHRGIDISTRMGAPVVAPADGVVSFVGRDRGYGNVVVVAHGYGLKTKYAHLKKALVKKGQHLKRGETVALVGSTGRSTGPHLHYEVHLNKVQVDPLRYILN